MSQNKFLKIVARVILGAMALAIMVIVVFSFTGVARVVAGTLTVLATTSALAWRFRRAIFAWLDGIIEENPFAIGGGAVMFLLFSALGGGYLFGSKGIGDSIYLGGVADVAFMALCMWRYTDHILPAREKAAREAAAKVVPISAALRRRDATVAGTTESGTAN